MSITPKLKNPQTPKKNSHDDLPEHIDQLFREWDDSVTVEFYSTEDFSDSVYIAQMVTPPRIGERIIVNNVSGRVVDVIWSINPIFYSTASPQPDTEEIGHRYVFVHFLPDD